MGWLVATARRRSTAYQLLIKPLNRFAGGRSKANRQRTPPPHVVAINQYFKPWEMIQVINYRRVAITDRLGAAINSFACTERRPWPRRPTFQAIKIMIMAIEKKNHNNDAKKQKKKKKKKKRVPRHRKKKKKKKKKKK